MTVWVVRAGKHGQDETTALEEGIAIVGWREFGDLSNIPSVDEMRALHRKIFPDMKEQAVINNAAQIWAFVKRINKGDIVVLPLKTQSAVALGKVTGDYEFRKGRHVRSVQWVRTDIPRDAFGQDLLYSMGAFMTVCQIRRNNAAERIKDVMAGRPDPVLVKNKENVDEPEDIPDIEQFAGDQIRSFISRKFKGHELAQLVAAVLRAQGYQLHVSSPGPDNGVDILAGRGAMGFEPPRLCVQVKSSDTPVGNEVLNVLRGSMSSHKAEQGLLVSWGGFKSTVQRELAKEFFSIRLWDSGKIVEAILENYDKLPEDLKADLPLKRIWTLVLEEDEG
ncbi:MAG: restriction endonuclease [Candidatus Pacebacteria bacterium]|nr:restriction endonuclease [Candidatus Paceibacterota bacterium]